MALTGLDAPLSDALSAALLLEAQLHVIGLSFLALALTKERAELTVARSRDYAREAGEARRRFLAQMSHEVRTPLNGVLGLAQVLSRDSRLLADQRQQVQTLEAAGRHLLAIVNDWERSRTGNVFSINSSLQYPESPPIPTLRMTVARTL